MLTSLDVISQGKSFPPFTELPRLDRYRTNKFLFDNKPQAVWVDWARRLEGDQGLGMMVALNYPQRLSKLWADMLFGETPRITVYPETQENVTDMTKMLLAQTLERVLSGCIRCFQIWHWHLQVMVRRCSKVPSHSSSYVVPNN